MCIYVLKLSVLDIIFNNNTQSQLQMPLTSGKSGATTQNYSSLLNSSMNTKPGILKSSLGKLSPTGVSHRRRSVSFDLGSPTRSAKDGGGAVMSLLTTRLKDQQKVGYFIRAFVAGKVVLS